MWKPPEGAERSTPQKREGSFWKPAGKGEVVIGRLVSISPPSNPAFRGDVALLAGVVVHPATGDTYGRQRLQVRMNTSLTGQLSRSDIGHVVALGYKGLKEQGSDFRGNALKPMRVYAVYRIPDAKYRDEIAALGAPELLDAAHDPRIVGPAADVLPDDAYDEEDDNLPF